MTKPLSSFPESERENIARRRVAKATGGIGMLAAVDFLNQKKERAAKKAIKASIDAIKNG